MLRLLSIIAFCAFATYCAGQVPPSQVVPLTAQVDANAPSITLQWPAAGDAPFFQVKRKSLDAPQWEVRAELPGTATTFVDQEVAIGEVWEYVVVRSDRLPTMDTVCVAAGTNITFTIHDTGGNGLCCWTSDGHWEIHACGELIARGGEFGFQDQFSFTMCGTSQCEELVVKIYPDHSFDEISWQVTSDQDVVLGSGMPGMAPRFGYILTGIEVPAVEQQGTLIMLVEASVSEPLTEELARLEKDLIGEGWLVVRHDVDADLPPMKVKDLIQATANATEDLRAVFLIGHVPVPYSGKIAPDEHSDHVGAWPADLYYAELNGEWTDDSLVWSPGSVSTRNHNVPGDGKFDQSTLPSDVDLILGRVDLRDLPILGVDEVELLREYLDRDHAFRSGESQFQRRAVIDEHFSSLDHESAVYRSCIPMFGEGQVYEAPFIATLSTTPHLWAMAGGPGSYTSAAGVGSSTDIANTQLNGAFAHLLGSYFGDWDVPNNFMRSILGKGMLGVVWGLQEMAFHHMALGLPIGESVRRSQNSHYETYERHGRLVHLALMGDPTLALLPIKRVDHLMVDSTPNGILLNWSPVDDDILGYHVFRRAADTEHFQRITDTPVQTTTFLDPTTIFGDLHYMVRPLKLEFTASGSYYVLGTGALAEISYTVGMQEERRSDLKVFPSPSQGIFTISIPEWEQNWDVRLFGLSGHEVTIWTERTRTGMQVHSEAADGLYILQVDDGAGNSYRVPVTIVR